MKQLVKIIGGKYRGKHLSFPTSEGLRPTPARVRETLFNWLMHDISGTRCLDAFSGSGALGFEAFSRGAKEVVLIEKSISVYQNLLKVAQTFQDANIQIIHHDTIDYLRSCPKPFDIIFLDPPFQENIYTSIIELINHFKLLKPGGHLYIESASPLSLSTEHWTQLRIKKAGSVYYALFVLEGPQTEKP